MTHENIINIIYISIYYLFIYTILRNRLDNGGGLFHISRFSGKILEIDIFNFK